MKMHSILLTSEPLNTLRAVSTGDADIEQGWLIEVK